MCCVAKLHRERLPFDLGTFLTFVCHRCRVNLFDTVGLCCTCRRDDPAASYVTDSNGLWHACSSRLRADSAAAGTSSPGVHPGCTLNNASSPSSLWHSPLPGTSSVRDTSDGLSCGDAFHHGLTRFASCHGLRHASHTGAAQLQQHLASSRTGSEEHGYTTGCQQPSTR